MNGDRYTVKMQEAEDGSGDLFFELPPEIIKEMDIKEGDEFDINEENGYIVITLKR